MRKHKAEKKGEKENTIQNASSYYFVSTSPHLLGMSTWIPVLPDNMNKYIQTHAPIYIYTHTIYIYISSCKSRCWPYISGKLEDYEAIAQPNPSSSKFRASLKGEERKRYWFLHAVNRSLSYGGRSNGRRDRDGNFLWKRVVGSTEDDTLFSCSIWWYPRRNFQSSFDELLFGWY